MNIEPRSNGAAETWKEIPPELRPIYRHLLTCGASIVPIDVVSAAVKSLSRAPNFKREDFYRLAILGGWVVAELEIHTDAPGVLKTRRADFDAAGAMVWLESIASARIEGAE